MVSEACHDEIVSAREEWGRGLLRVHRASRLHLHSDRGIQLCGVSISVCRYPLSPHPVLVFSAPFLMTLLPLPLLSPPHLLPSPTLFSSSSFTLPCLSLYLHRPPPSFSFFLPYFFSPFLPIFLSLSLFLTLCNSCSMFLGPTMFFLNSSHHLF